MHDAVAFEEIQDQLLTLDQLYERLAVTEPLSELTFPVGEGARFSVAPGWADLNDYDAVDAYLDTPGGSRFQLTKKALLEAGASVGAPREFQQRIRAGDLESMLNHWFQGDAGDKEFKVLSHSRPRVIPTPDGDVPAEPLALAMCRGTVTPFSNLRLLDIAVGRIRAMYGADAEVWGDYKFGHDLERTDMRLIVPGHSRVITGTRVADDTWCSGISLTNSLIGIYPARIQGYLFRWWCTNGCTDELASTPQFSRKRNYDLADVWDWAARSVDEVLEGLEGTLDGVQQLAGVPVASEVTTVLEDLFERYGVPVRERNRIIASMADITDPTMYDIMQEITRAANMPGLSQRAINQLLGLGGHVSYAATARCDADHPCQRLLPPNWQPPASAVNSPVQQDPSTN